MAHFQWLQLLNGLHLALFITHLFSTVTNQLSTSTSTKFVTLSMFSVLLISSSKRDLTLLLSQKKHPGHFKIWQRVGQAAATTLEPFFTRKY